MFTAGGGSQNPVWTILRESELGMDINAATQSEAAIGSAKLVQIQTSEKHIHCIPQSKRLRRVLKYKTQENTANCAECTKNNLIGFCPLDGEIQN